MENFSVEFYEMASGECPAKEFIKTQGAKMRAKIYRVMSLLKSEGINLRMPHSEHLDDGIFQLRAQVGSDITRVLYFFVIGRKIIVTNGFVKKTDKVPPNEKKKAIRYRSDYLGRKGNQI